MRRYDRKALTQAQTAVLYDLYEFGMVSFRKLERYVLAEWGISLSYVSIRTRLQAYGKKIDGVK